MSDLIEGSCPFCGSEVIETHEYGKEGPQWLTCCRLIPMCGARFTLEGWLIEGADQHAGQDDQSDVVDLVGALQKAVAAARARRLGEASRGQ